MELATTHDSTFRLNEQQYRIRDSVVINHPHAPPMLQANEIVVLKEIECFLLPFHSATEQMSAEKYEISSKAIPIKKCLKATLETLTPTNDLAKKKTKTFLAIGI